METLPPSPDDAPPLTTWRQWLFPLLLLMVLVGIVLSNRWGLHAPSNENSRESAASTPSEQPTDETVQLVIDFGNGEKRQIDALPWREGLTVADVLVAAQDYRREIRFSQIGTGESGLLTEIDGVKNEGVNAKNWLYEVNDQPATVSFCLQKVAPGDLIRWRFTDDAEEQ